MSGSTPEATPELAQLCIRWGQAWEHDVAGTLYVDHDDEPESLWGHMSSTVGWLERDLLHNFGRDQKLAERFPQGYEVTWEPQR